MTFEAIMFRHKAGKSDAIRDAAIPLPQGITEKRDISYGVHGDSNLLDVCYPEGTTAPLPTIVSIHGGGFVYGTKEIYRRYCMDLASRGFAVVNFNYRLAPKWRFPTPLLDINAVMQWIIKNAARYYLDPDRIFLVGDSAGAQLSSQYAAMHTNPEFAALFPVQMAKIRIRAVGLNCGTYDMHARASNRKGVNLDYLGRKISSEDPRLQVLKNITGQFPPAYITPGPHDFLRDQAEPMYKLLTEKGVDAQWKCYGAEDNEAISHVFHVNIILPEAKQCNDDTAAFFKAHL